MREYSLFTGTENQQRVAKEGNKAIRVAIDSTVKQVKSDGEKDAVAKEALTYQIVRQYVTPVLVQYRSAGADDTEPRELIALELRSKLGIHVSSTF